MKFKHTATFLAALALTVTSCNDFLDELPDNRTEVTTADQVTKLLVSAYPTASWNMIAEYSSDNTDCNGSRYQNYDVMTEETYLWKDTKEIGNDSPSTLWSSCYSAVATANLALEAIENMGNPEELSAQRGEALLCRAYGHFILSYIFCEAWSPSNKDKAMGIPYSTQTETTVNPRYDRETIGKTYEHIQADIEEGLPLIDDNLYTVPKYHFNKKAANAFAARFYLYTQQYDKAIECANTVLGSNPTLVLRDWKTFGGLSFNDNVQPDAYVDAANTANLLLKTAISLWGIYNGPVTLTCLYTHNAKIADYETCQSTGVWGKCTETLKAPAASYTSIPKILARKFPLYYFEVIDPNAYTGYYHIVEAPFTTDETLLVRAEAYTMKKQYDKALADMQLWQNNYTTSTVQLTEDVVNDFYGKMNYYRPDQPTPKKALHPDFTVEEGTQENMIHFILHARRILTLHEGLRWGDIKRYGITIYRRDWTDKNNVKVTDTLLPDDPRRAIQIPETVRTAGLTANPR